MTVSEHIDALRKLMKERGYDIYIVPTDDFHQSENVGAYFQARTFITGFDGSAGTAIITLDHAGLWTDGRYFLQAEQQLSGTPVTLYRMLEPGVPSINEFLEKHLPEHGTIGFGLLLMSLLPWMTFAGLPICADGTLTIFLFFSPTPSSPWMR